MPARRTATGGCCWRCSGLGRGRQRRISPAALAAKLFKHKLAPDPSPNKTIEGLLGGLLLSLAAVAMVGAMLIGARVDQLPRSSWSLATVLFSVVGDLFENLLKRHVGARIPAT